MNMPVKVACLQMELRHLLVKENLQKASAMVEEACDAGANLLVLPEVFNTGSGFANREEVYKYAEKIPEGQTVSLLIELAKARKVYITGSLLEVDGVDVYNTAVLVGPEGYVGKFRKLHPCGGEVYNIEPGDTGIPVFRTPIGRIALLVCLDAYYPESFRIAALQGADIVCVPFHSDDAKVSRNLPEPFHTMAPVLCMANALSNHIFVAGCNSVGNRDGQVQAGGQSVVANQWGAWSAPMASYDKEEIIYAEVDLADSRRKYFHPTNSRLANRRTDVYSADLGYDAQKYRQ